MDWKSDCFGLGPFRPKFRANIIGITMYLGLCDGATMSDTTVIAKQEDSALWDVIRKKVLGPGHSAFSSPSPTLGSPQSVQEYNTDPVSGHRF